jgi:glutaredoxin
MDDTPVDAPAVTLYGKKGCGKCDSAKSKLDMLHIAYRYVDMEAPPEDWRLTQLAAARAHYDYWVHTDAKKALPVIEINSVLNTYTEAMSLLKTK